MIEKLLQDQRFERVMEPDRFWQTEDAIYENCVFSDSNFQKTKLSGLKFYDCLFDHCDLSLVSVQQTIFQQVQFKDCKMAGILFDSCHTFGLEMRFFDCKLDHCSFYHLKLHKAIFQNCSLRGVDFSGAVLKEAQFMGSDLTDAKFDQTNLEKADFRGAIHYQIHPQYNQIKGASFSMDGLPGLLTAYKIKVMP